MYRIIGERSSGKTRKLMEIAKQDNAYFVCENPKAMENKAYNYGITGITFVSYETFYTKMLIGDDNFAPVVIDDLDNYFTYVGKVIGYTISED